MTDEIIEFCTKKWEVDSEDPRIKFFIEKKEKFYDGFSDDMKECIDSLLKEFDYYSHRSINREYSDLHKKLESEQDFDIGFSIFTFLKSQDKSYNSSYGFTEEYRTVNDISRKNIIPDLRDCFENSWWIDIQSIVFVDDFCGSGKTFSDYIDTVKQFVKDKHIFYIVVHAMEQGVENIEEYAKKNDLHITILTNHYAKPAFCDENFRKYKEPFISLSKKRKIANNHIMGFYDSQALVAFCENTPNNTLGIFRYKTKKNEAIFPRVNDQSPAFLMKERRIQKGIDNYANDRRSRGYE